MIILKIGDLNTFPLDSIKKIISIIGRDKNHKRIKDLCDLVSLCLYFGDNLETLKSELDFLKKEKIIRYLDVINNDNIEYTAKLLNLDNGIIINLLNKLKN